MTARRLVFAVNHAAFFASHRLPIAEAARAAGWDVHVIASARSVDRDAAAARLIADRGFPFHEIPFVRGGLAPRAELAALTRLVGLYRTLAPSVVHHVTLKPVLFGTLAARLARVPGVVNAVSGLGFVFLDESWTGRARRLAIRTAYRRFTAHPNRTFIFQNDDDRREFVEASMVPRDATTLIRGSGVDLTAFAPTPFPGGPPVVVLPARLLGDKGVREFVAAAGRLREDGVLARFALVGDLDPNPASVQAAELTAWQADGVVEWWGYRADMPAVFASAHVVCLPSYREGLPKALIEAAASGRAVVTTDVPGCRDAIEPGVTGLLVPARTVQPLADALRSLLTDPARRAAMGAAGRQLAERVFGVERVVEATLAIYERLLTPTP